MTKSPPIQPLNREKLKESDGEKLKEGYTLKRSGTVVRSIRGSNCSQMRTWEPLPSTTTDNLNRSPASEKNLMLAEVVEYSLCVQEVFIFRYISNFTFRPFIS